MLVLGIAGMNTEIDFDMEEYVDSFPIPQDLKKAGFSFETT